MMCSAACTRAERLATSSPGSTGTRDWITAGPPSSSAVTKCTVTPCSRSPAASARAWVSSPGWRGSSEGWMFSMRPAYRATNAPDSTRMKPASTTASAACATMCLSIAASKAARSSRPSRRKALASATATSRPRSLARCTPPAPGWSLMTTATSAGISPWLQAWAMATMLLPAPEIRIARRMGSGVSVNHDARAARADVADERGALAGAVQQLHRLIGPVGCHHGDHADAAVEGAMHLGRLDVAGGGKPVEQRIAMPGTALEPSLQPLGQHARDVVGESAASDVREGVHRQRGGELQHALHVDARGLEQPVEQGPALELRVGVGTRHLDELAHQRIAIRVHAGGGHADDGIPGLHLHAID